MVSARVDLGPGLHTASDAARIADLARRVADLEAQLARVMATPAQEVFSRDEAAEFLRIGQRFLDDLIGSGRLPSCRIGARVVIRRQDLFSFLEESRA